MALAVGAAASVALWVTDTGYRAEQVLCLIAVVGLIAFDLSVESRWEWTSFAIPAIVLIDIAVLFWDPTLGIVVQGALIGSLTALFAVGIALVYRANRVVNF